MPINWPDIDTVLLDMDGTLLDLFYDNYFWLEYLPLYYATRHAVTLEQAKTVVYGHSEATHGSLDWYCLDHWSEVMGFDIQPAKEQIRRHIRLRPHALEFLDFLHESGKSTLLVTNAHPDALELKVEASGLHSHPALRQRVSSHEFRLAKENTGFWRALAGRAGISLARSLVIDDNPAVLRCARREGVGTALQVLQPDSTRAAIPASEEFPGIIHFTEIMQASR